MRGKCFFVVVVFVHKPLIQPFTSNQTSRKSQESRPSRQQLNNERDSRRIQIMATFPGSFRKKTLTLTDFLFSYLPLRFLIKSKLFSHRTFYIFLKNLLG